MPNSTPLDENAHCLPILLSLIEMREEYFRFDKVVAICAWTYELRMAFVILSKRELLDNHKVANLEFCEHCTSLGGARYFLSIIDDFSRMTWVFMMKHKSEAFEKFKHWKILIENQTGRKIKRLRTDNRFEFCSREFESAFVEMNGIVRHYTVSYTPWCYQTKRVAERMKQTLFGESKLKEGGLPETVDMLLNRPDIAHAMSVVSRYMAHPGKEHWNAVKRIFRYLKGTSDVGLIYGGEREYLVAGYSDSDYAADLDARRSLTGYVFTIGSSVVSWKATLQPSVALSTTEAEYMALTEAAKEGIWLKGLIEDLGFPQDQAIVFCDSMSAICLAKDQVYQDRPKHFEVRNHFIHSKEGSK
ncbi:secreted RxLR effector protein 161-like protein [Tanacetum coccineum]